MKILYRLSSNILLISMPILLNGCGDNPVDGPPLPGVRMENSGNVPVLFKVFHINLIDTLQVDKTFDLAFGKSTFIMFESGDYSWKEVGKK